MPRHRVHVDGLYVDRYEVTNALFARFVKATGHKTRAEREGDGLVWQQKDGTWRYVKVRGASWRTPDRARPLIASAPPGGAGLVVRRRGVLPVGGQAAADGGGVGEGGTGDRRATPSLG